MTVIGFVLAKIQGWSATKKFIHGLPLDSLSEGSLLVVTLIRHSRQLALPESGRCKHGLVYDYKFVDVFLTDKYSAGVVLLFS